MTKRVELVGSLGIGLLCVGIPAVLLWFGQILGAILVVLVGSALSLWAYNHLRASESPTDTSSFVSLNLARQIPTAPTPAFSPPASPLAGSPNLGANMIKVPAPLTDREWRVCWSQQQNRELSVYVWNHTPNAETCTVILNSVKRFSESQQLYVDDTDIDLFPFQLFVARVVPEDDQTRYRIIETIPNGFMIRGKGRTCGKYREGQWQLNLRMRAGNRERTQELVFLWARDVGLTALEIGTWRP